jgi:hypothetical protein
MVAVALVSPAADAVMMAVPVAVGVRLDVAIPPTAVTGEAGLNDPDTPLTEKVTGLEALATVLPLASWIVAV